jgi:hypothetical protein
MSQRSLATLLTPLRFRGGCGAKRMPGIWSSACPDRPPPSAAWAIEPNRKNHTIPAPTIKQNASTPTAM